MGKLRYRNCRSPSRIRADPEPRMAPGPSLSYSGSECLAGLSYLLDLLEIEIEISSISTPLSLPPAARPTPVVAGRQGAVGGGSHLTERCGGLLSLHQRLPAGLGNLPQPLMGKNPDGHPSPGEGHLYPSLRGERALLWYPKLHGPQI